MNIHSWAIYLLPYNLCHKVFFAKDLIAQFFEIINLTIINRNKNHTIIPQKICRQPKAGVHHIEPVCVVAAHGFRVGLGGLLGDFLVPGHRIGKIIGIDKIVAGIVGRVYVPTDFDTKEKALSVAKAAEKGLK